MKLRLMFAAVLMMIGTDYVFASASTEVTSARRWILTTKSG